MKINYVVILVAGTDRGAYLYVNGEHLSSYDPLIEHEGEKSKLECLAQDLAEIHNTEVQTFELSDKQISSLFDGQINMFEMDFDRLSHVVKIKDVAVKYMSDIESAVMIFHQRGGSFFVSYTP